MLPELDNSDWEEAFKYAQLKTCEELVPINEEIKKENPKVNLKTRFQILKIK